MIQVHITHRAKAIRLEAKGHAMTAEPGRDLVCAAVSAVIFGFAKAVSEIPGDRISMGQIDVGRQEGYALVSVACKDVKTYKRIRAYLEPVYQSLAALAQVEPDAVRIQVVEP